MPIQIEIICENRIVLQTFSDPLDSNQLIELRKKMYHVILPAATQKLYIIADFQGVKNPPSTLLSSATGMVRTRHANAGLLVCVSAHPLLTAMAHALSELVPQRPLIVVSSLEAALERIRPLLEPVNS
jgi:hypothetical protein